MEVNELFTCSARSRDVLEAAFLSKRAHAHKAKVYQETEILV